MSGILLAQKGYSVSIFEKRTDPQFSSIYNGRSINLALSERGLKALGLAGLKDTALTIGVPMYGRIVHTSNGVNFHPYGKDNQCIYSVSRSGLNNSIIEESRKSAGIQFHFDHDFLDWIPETQKLIVHDKSSDTIQQFKTNILLGADGAFSGVRKVLERYSKINTNIQEFPFGYKEADVPASPNGDFLLEKNALHIWPQKSFMLIALPNTDGTFTCTLFLGLKGDVSFEKLKSLTDWESFVAKYFPDLAELAPSVAVQLAENPVSVLSSLTCYPWSYENTAFLIGDAAHAILPFYGQGMNAGFEDISILSELIDEHDGNWEQIIPTFEQSRKPNADAIRELAERNFIEMRDLVTDPEFLVKRALEHHIVEWTQGKWTPLYTMVTFSHLPYSEALNKGNLQDQLLEKIIRELSINSECDWEKLKVAVLSYLSK